MPKVLCLTGMVIAILILVLFLLDLAVKFPFQRISTAHGCHLCGLCGRAWATSVGRRCENRTDLGGHRNCLKFPPARRPMPQRR